MGKTDWAIVNSQTIISSFKNCVISVHTDGTQDTQIHYMKARQMAVNAQETVSFETAKLVAEVDRGSIDLDGDPFASDVEEDEAIMKDGCHQSRRKYKLAARTHLTFDKVAAHLTKSLRTKSVDAFMILIT